MDDSFYNTLKHIRLIHFTLIVVTSTIMYSEFSIYRDIPEEPDILRELHEIIRVTKDEETLIGDIINDRWNSLLRQFESGLNMDYNPGYIRAENLKQLAKLQAKYMNQEIKFQMPSSKANLGEWRTAIEENTPIINAIKNINFKAGDVEWAQKKSFYKTVPKTVITGHIKIISIGTIDSVSNAESKALSIKMNLRASSYMWTYDRQGMITNAKHYPNIDRIVDAVIVIGSERLTPVKWFYSKFTNLYSSWYELENITMEQALSITNKRITEAMNRQKPTILGITIDGEHIGAIGLIVIAAILLYLWKYLAHFNESLGNTWKDNIQVGILPWVGVMRGMSSTIIIFLTILLLPVICAVFLLLLFIDWGDVSLIVMSSISILGYLFIGWKIKENVSHLQNTIANLH